MAADRKRKLDDDAGNMFDTSATAAAALNSARSATRVLSKLNTGLRRTGATSGNAEWDDEDGYYVATFQETIAERYVVTDTACGRGVYSSIVKARDIDLAAEGTTSVAIKIVRANDVMQQAAKKEISILQKLKDTEGEGKRYIVEMLSSFSYRNHTCIVFECLWDDCREALRKLTKGQGMTLSVVRLYTKQLLLGLRHLEKLNILHADIKPDNILMSENQQIVKLCDFGTAMEIGEIAISSYIMSRAYRAPEIIIGCQLTTSADMFALGVTLFELFTGKALASGKSNHDQLRKLMEISGRMSQSVLKSGAFWRRHFDENLSLKPDVEADPRHTPSDESAGGLRLKIDRLKAQLDVFPKYDIKEFIFERVGPDRCKSAKPEDQKYVQRGTRFAALLQHMLCLDPRKRLRPKEGLMHELFT
eukprot:TRINITY_DN40860_c0_g1_i1.p1 TRINITY_DN40860_c0_g1~~TRINITY_DN40860_c0_g1_i1.p1  ORF type:complete len:443 (+),score=63.82 TRINITY_DN40860_c0_g1_i1:73-1329(+)